MFQTLASCIYKYPYSVPTTFLFKGIQVHKNKVNPKKKKNSSQQASLCMEIRYVREPVKKNVSQIVSQTTACQLLCQVSGFAPDCVCLGSDAVYRGGNVGLDRLPVSARPGPCWHRAAVNEGIPELPSESSRHCQAFQVSSAPKGLIMSSLQTDSIFPVTSVGLGSYEMKNRWNTP